MNRISKWILGGIALTLLAAGGFYVGIRESRIIGKADQIVVCIDPGHPSETNSGRTRQHGTTEIEINWVVALKLESLLKQDGRIRVVKTREDLNQMTRNRDRAILANREGAAVVIHLHCDAGPSCGFTTYYPDRRGTSDGASGPSDRVLSVSKKAAFTVHAALSRVLAGALSDRGVKGESFTLIGHRNGGLTTSIWSEVPTMTVEMVFLSNRSDAAFISSEEGQWLMAKALAAGIKDYIRPQLDNLARRCSNNASPALSPGQ